MIANLIFLVGGIAIGVFLTTLYIISILDKKEEDK